MMSLRPSRPSPAMIVALLSLCVALGGSAIAATSSGGDPATAAAKKKKLAPKNSVNSAAVINNSLKLGDFKKSERAKLKGDTGAQGAQGIQGPAGTPDGYTKTEADGKYLGKTEKAADSNLLDGKDSSDYIQGEGSQSFRQGVFSDAFTRATHAVGTPASSRCVNSGRTSSRSSRNSSWLCRWSCAPWSSSTSPDSAQPLWPS